MLKNNLLAKSVKFALIGGAATAAFTSTAVLAEEDGAKVERIEVTGSRIQRTDIETVTPITSIGRAEIMATGAINVADVLNQSPVAIAGSDQSNTSFSTSSVGLNTTSLRGLGEARTLVLVNGRRFVSGVSPSSGYAVDLNAIPTSMIERIDILKSASSAVYGSDAVAGVVNIITRKDFEGVEVDALAGISQESDRQKHAINITAGNTWDTGNATFAVGYDEDKGLKSSDRDFSRFDQAVVLDKDGNEMIGNIFSSYPPQGRVGGLNADGTPFNFAHEEGKNRFNRASYRQLVTPLKRSYVAFNIREAISDDIEFFGEANWNSSKTFDSTIEPTPFSTDDVFLPARGGKGGIKLSNPMVPQKLRDALIAQRNAAIKAREEARKKDPSLPVINPLTDDDIIPTLVRRMVEFGARSTDLERSTIRFVNGIDWAINDNWNFNGYVSWGQTDQSQENGGQVNVERAALAFDVIKDANGNLVCRNELARLQGCVPLNLFGAGTVTQDAVDYVRSPAKVSGQVQQFVVAGSVTGELPLELPGGNIGVAMGVEHRLEKGTFKPGDLAQTGASSTNKSEPTDGSFTSDDVFVEAVLPVLDNLELDLAARYTDHEITGGDTTWNAGIKYSPIESLSLRASAAKAVRTPNIADLFGGRGETFAGVTDPCNNVKASDTSEVAKNCLSIPSIAARVARDGSFKLTQVEAQSTGGTVGGSKDVKAEIADTLSLGFVWQVIDGLSMTVDYYDISIDNAIATTGRTTVLNRCFEVSKDKFDPTCDGKVVRDGNGALTEVHSGKSNENRIETSGVDIELNYTMDLGDGTLKADLVWNHANKFETTPLRGGETIDSVGEVLSPDDRANLNLYYTLNELDLSWRMRYWSASTDSNEGSNFNFTNFKPLEKFNNFGGVVYHDMSVGYHITDKVQATLNVRNIFDKQPQFAGQGFSSGGTGINTVSEAFDVTGRYFQLGFNVKF
ncbi:TonB-dependent receptor [Parashewanella curva]|uniref:TonB-dependent receptor n=1 Tax=Parashewanella curva TaxID=2338552 RepID=A0A3L8PYN2_9GAMM|nr:TonB-dependent receptor [Parashewanella curva]RLV60330.1 TonB-dependent receptor [Parashewanella curva]